MLRERDFALFFWGQAVSVLGDGIFPIALAFAVLDLGGSPTALGIVLVAGILPQTFFVLIGGVWADRLPRRTIMLSSDLARALIQAATAVLLLTGEARIWQLVVLYGLSRPRRRSSCPPRPRSCPRSRHTAACRRPMPCSASRAASPWASARRSAASSSA